MDEVFHVPQAKHFCAGRFHVWDPKITTFPGLYLLASSVASVSSFVASAAQAAALAAAQAGGLAALAATGALATGAGLATPSFRRTGFSPQSSSRL